MLDERPDTPPDGGEGREPGEAEGVTGGSEDEPGGSEGSRSPYHGERDAAIERHEKLAPSDESPPPPLEDLGDPAA